MDTIVASDASLQGSSFLLPGVCCNWDPSLFSDLNFVETFRDRMADGGLTLQHYPASACNTGESETGGQAQFPSFLNHLLSTQTVSLNSLVSGGCT